ncbi:hypothetical protein JK363_39175 [Streptomyces sp. 205]|uniref:Uncharacterized protein n=1 Tax=Streptomyces coffeae TaxID=621382 RepID=A0ABS1NR35_9ACTN|nr:hypothetical protein [Streptomyces coffeae]
MEPVAGASDTVLAADPPAVTQLQIAELPPLVLVAKQVSRSPSRSVKRNWAPE